MTDNKERMCYFCRRQIDIKKHVEVKRVDKYNSINYRKNWYCDDECLISKLSKDINK